MASDPNGGFVPGGRKSGESDEDGGATGDGAVESEVKNEEEEVTQDNKDLTRNEEAVRAQAIGVVPLEITSLISGFTAEIYGTITNLSDNWSSNFNEEAVYGRIDPIPTFSNTTRTISVSIDLVPITKAGDSFAASAKASQVVISDIAKMCYPGYQSMDNGNINFNASVLKSAPLVEIKHANVICSTDGGPLKGYIKSFTTSVQHDGLYSLAGATANTTTGDALKIFYNRISISLEFGILHDEEMGYDETGEAKGRFGSFPYFFP